LREANFVLRPPRIMSVIETLIRARHSKALLESTEED